jgi:hypothetical protein
MATRVKKKKSRAVKPAKKKSASSSSSSAKKKRKKAGGSPKRREQVATREKVAKRRRSASKLTPQQKAAATRKRNAAELEAKKAKRREAARRRREELESIKLTELERKRARRSVRKGRREADERQLLIDVLEEMRNIAAGVMPMSLEITEAEVGARIPWLVVGRFDPLEDVGYGEIDEVFRTWETDLLLEARIHPQRLSQIRIIYSDPNAKRGEGDSIVSHTGAWESVISEIAAELDPSDEDSLASRYENTTVPNFYVYFSGQLASEAEISL